MSKRLLPAAVLLLLACAARAQPGRRRDDERRRPQPRRAAQNRPATRPQRPPRPRRQPRPPVPPKRAERLPVALDRAGVQRRRWPEKRPLPKVRPADPSRLLRDRRGEPPPPLDERGRPVSLGRVENRAPDHAGVDSDGGMRSLLARQRREEQQRERVYWHVWRGRRYCHYFDRWGAQWYGFYAGPRFYWTRYYMDRWWWRDPDARRWCYWYRGYWWWQDPGAPGAVYVYVDGRYVPYGSLASYAGGPALTFSITPSPTPQAYASDAPVQSYYDSDGSRLAQIAGDDREANLYDAAVTGTPAYIATLSTNAATISFLTEPDQRLVLYRLDGSSAAFDLDGRPLR